MADASAQTGRGVCVRVRHSSNDDYTGKIQLDLHIQSYTVIQRQSDQIDSDLII